MKALSVLEEKEMKSSETLSVIIATLFGAAFFAALFMKEGLWAQACISCVGLCILNIVLIRENEQMRKQIREYQDAT